MTYIMGFTTSSELNQIVFLFFLFHHLILNYYELFELSLDLLNQLDHIKFLK
jgi:hypothetical protein